MGENYADELVAKADATLDDRPGPAPEWHYLGAIQRNKVPRLAPIVSCWQGVWPGSRRAGPSPAGAPGPGSWSRWTWPACPAGVACAPADVAGLVAALRDEDLDVAGLMAVGSPGPPEGARAGFREVRRLADELDLAVRSMGMTDDLEVALSEGSTMVRVGRAPLRGPPIPAALSAGRARSPGGRKATGRATRIGTTHYAVAGRNKWQLRS